MSVTQLKIQGNTSFEVEDLSELIAVYKPEITELLGPDINDLEDPNTWTYIEDTGNPYLNIMNGAILNKDGFVRVWETAQAKVVIHITPMSVGVRVENALREVEGPKLSVLCYERFSNEQKVSLLIDDNLRDLLEVRFDASPYRAELKKRKVNLSTPLSGTPWETLLMDINKQAVQTGSLDIDPNIQMGRTLNADELLSAVVDLTIEMGRFRVNQYFKLLYGLLLEGGVIDYKRIINLLATARE